MLIFQAKRSNDGLLGFFCVVLESKISINISSLHLPRFEVILFEMLSVGATNV